jgi:hypothetical protein
MASCWLGNMEPVQTTSIAIDKTTSPVSSLARLRIFLVAGGRGKASIARESATTPAGPPPAYQAPPRAGRRVAAPGS